MSNETAVSDATSMDNIIGRLNEHNDRLQKEIEELEGFIIRFRGPQPAKEEKSQPESPAAGVYQLVQDRLGTQEKMLENLRVSVATIKAFA
jgi:hypothetical protein